jgi:hypothetical protein
MTAEEARELYSEYLGNRLDMQTKDDLQAFLAKTPECAAEFMQFERMLSLLHRTPPREPTIDLWPEFAPRVEEYCAERRLTPAQKFKIGWGELVSSLSAGLILWTHALAAHTWRRLERHLLVDPAASHSDSGDA